ncbi:AfsR/SARP family transcriptional regulator [Actinocatenispora rupis]|uniref:SARP family transcriptional regulator n=1 Tax=Actinocatenispora rupis TaxID=519421 RepID=A0A8J3IYG8_9ACTN|nr:BTAD domain-containing putative transcriptional regulator [Actinocatenispora rupis]GID10973.1 SARP family transcriptional regulator [Actinocatenispora rupis]
MRFAVLGPLTVRAPDGTAVHVPGERCRAVLAVLLWHANRPVPVSVLTEAVWQGAPPSSAAANLQTYVSRLRRLLPDTELSYAHGAYRLVVADGDLDRTAYATGVAAARAALARGDAPAAAAGLRAALGLWRDRPLVDVPVPLLEPEADALEDDRLAVVEDCMDAELAGGRHADLVGELQALVGKHPLRERLRGQLLRALAASGRTAEALDAYQRTRTELVDALGVEPGPDLRELHTRILRGEPAAPAPRPPAAPTAVCQLPAQVPDFTGRQDEVTALTALLTATTDAVPVAVLTGTPGGGKTALAVRVAHAVRSHFPDGQLFVHLAGGSSTPRPAADVLAELLRSLGMAGPNLPDGLDERAAAFRSLLADRRVLVVLDDAADPAQVRPLLPGTAGSAVLVTGRRQLPALSGHARPVRLGPLDAAEAEAMLARIVGADRLAAEPAATTRVLAACGRLPLAVRVAGARLADRTDWAVETLADRLDDEQRRLDELAVDDVEVRASLALSYAGLAAPVRRGLRLLALLDPVTVADWSIAALLGDGDPTAEYGEAGDADTDRVVGALVAANLLDPVGRDRAGQPRYRLHDLLRVYGRERARAEDPVADRRAALRRLFHRAATLTVVADGGVPRQEPVPRLPGDPPPPTAAGPLVARIRRDPRAFLDAERSNLIAAAVHVAGQGRTGEAAWFAGHLHPQLWLDGRTEDLIRLHTTIRDAAAAAGDAPARLRAEYLLGRVRTRRGEHDAALRAVTGCQEEAERLGLRHLLACCLATRGHLLRSTASFADDSPGYARRAVELFAELDDRPATVAAERELALALNRSGRTDEAFAALERAVAGARALTDPALSALVLNGYGVWLMGAGRYAEARDAGEECLAALRRLDDRIGCLQAICQIGLADLALGHHDEAVRRFAEARAGALAYDDVELATFGSLVVATSWIAAGRADEAVPVVERCVRTFREVTQPRRVAQGLHVLAAAYEALGRAADADRTRAEATALDGYDGTGAPRTLSTRLLLRLAAGRTTD